jgi:hypothetical protein
MYDSLAHEMNKSNNVPNIGSSPVGSVNHEQMVHGQMRRHQNRVLIPTQPGQGAFAVIQEIVGVLEADPKTDRSKG